MSLVCVVYRLLRWDWRHIKAWETSDEDISEEVKFFVSTEDLKGTI
jgi:hypothetical protein